MFLIKYTDNLGEQVVRLRPGPTAVEYPEILLFEKLDSQDGTVILQRALHDPRPRQWIWKGYRSYTPLYEDLWQFIMSLNTKHRKDAGLSLFVEIWENDSGGENPYNNTTDGYEPDLIGYSNLDWVKVKFIQTHRTTRKDGGPTTYEESVITFVHTL